MTDAIWADAPAGRIDAGSYDGAEWSRLRRQAAAVPSPIADETILQLADRLAACAPDSPAGREVWGEVERRQSAWLQRRERRLLPRLASAFDTLAMDWTW